MCTETEESGSGNLQLNWTELIVTGDWGWSREWQDMKLERYQFLKDLVGLIKDMYFVQKAVGATEAF